MLLSINANLMRFYFLVINQVIWIPECSKPHKGTFRHDPADTAEIRNTKLCIFRTFSYAGSFGAPHDEKHWKYLFYSFLFPYQQPFWSLDMLRQDIPNNTLKNSSNGSNTKMKHLNWHCCTTFLYKYSNVLIWQCFCWMYNLCWVWCTFLVN